MFWSQPKPWANSIGRPLGFPLTETLLRAITLTARSLRGTVPSASTAAPAIRAWATCGAPGASAGPASAQRAWRCSSLRPMTMRWISEVPSPMSSSGASRYSRSISYSLE